MGTTSSPGARRRGPIPLIILLILALGLTAALAYQAAAAARSHRVTAEAALRDYAAVGAWQFGRMVTEHVYATLATEQFHLEEVVSRQGGLPTPAEHARLHEDDADCGCAGLDSIRYFFRFDPDSRALAVTGAAPATEVRAWLADTLAAHVADAEPGIRRPIALIGRFRGEPRTVVFRIRRPTGGPEVVYGYETTPSVLVPVLERCAEKEALLPPALTGGEPNDSILALAVWDAGGEPLFLTPGEHPMQHFAEETLEENVGRLRVRASIRPEAAAALVIGGLPRSRLPLLLGLMLVSAGLMAAAAVQLRREAELARLRADFVSGVSHELRTPLAQIRMFGEMLLLGRVQTAADRRRSAEIVVKESKRLTHLVENVLHFARAERGAVQVAPEPCRLDRLVGEVADGFGALAATRDARIRVAARPGVLAAVDPDAVRQILLNLLDNAVKYGPAGQTVTVRLEHDGGRALLSVEDQGPGVPPRDRERIWEPFARLGRDTGSAVGGSGIGLAVVRELVALHGGVAWVEDGTDGGARFVVRLPGARSAAEERRSVRPATDAVPAAEPGNTADAVPAADGGSAAEPARDAVA